VLGGNTPPIFRAFFFPFFVTNRSRRIEDIRGGCAYLPGLEVTAETMTLVA
jgi:hypothetical protein